MTSAAPRRDWADDDDDALPEPVTTKNADGTETTVSYFIREDGKKIKSTRTIKKTVRKELVNKRIAERKQWAKFGDEAGRPTGPQSDTTSVGEDIKFNPRQNFRAIDADKAEDAKKKELVKDTKIKCRICSGDHWTTKCPFKETMAPESEPAPAAPLDLNADDKGSGSGRGGSYVPPQLRNKAGMTGEKMGSKYERDDLATLRVTNVSEFAEEQDLRDMFSRFGHVTRVFLAKDRETGRAKGFAFVSFADRMDAAKACEKMDGFGYGHLILRVEFAKKAS
jgi:translation initiation factor 3 subunit G